VAVAKRAAPPRGRSTRPSSRRGRSRPAPRGSAALAPPRRQSRAAEAQRHVDDVYGWLLLVLGALGVLGVYLGLLGPAGGIVHRYGSAAFGWGLDVVPLGLIVLGWTLISARARRGAGFALGALLIFLLASAGLADLAGGHPTTSATARVVGGAGGYAGAEIGGGLRDLLGAAGAAVVLVAVAMFAVSALLARTIGQTVSGLGKIAIWSWRGIVAFFTVPAQDREEETAGAPSEPPTVVDWTLDGEDAIGEDPSHALASLVAETRTGRFVVGETVDEPSEASAAPTQPTVSVPASREFVEASSAVEQLGLGVVPAPSNWTLPPARLLKRSKELATDRSGVEERGRVLERALAAHGVDTRVTGFTVGPTVTRFELELAAGVKVARVTSLSKDIAYAMASPDVRILAPIPGRSAIGVEVPNHDRRLVTLGDVLASNEAHRATHPLEVALGRDIAGRPVMVNLAEMPHLLIAGATGSGKSSCINSIVTSVIMRSTPEHVRLILVDPKRVELGHYNGLPHLLTQVVVNPKRAANALRWAVEEMERRYDLLAEVGMRDITGYNTAIDRGDLADSPLDSPMPDDSEAAEDLDISGDARKGRFARLPYILVIVDELNDLMMVAARDVEESICRIAQMARAVGIHLVIATQRPSVDVITGVIKANIPSRLAFSVSSLADSRVILDQAGAERLVGRGDLLLLSASSSVARRVQAPWVSEDEVRAVVGYWRRQSDPLYVDGIVGEDAHDGTGSFTGDDEDDELLRKAMELVVRSQLGSTSMLQRKLRVGFARAGRLMDLLEQRGIVGPSEGSKARAVLMTPDELDALTH
jgi:DNA segregation ATPase FtsK/SpoIIIE, S-DNA-T family